MGRVAVVKGVMPETALAMTVNRLCGSSLQAILTAA